MKTLRFFRLVMPILLIQHCAGIASAQSPNTEKTTKKEKHRIKLVKIENGVTVTLDTTFTNREDLEKFNKENLKNWVPNGEQIAPHMMKFRDETRDVEVTNGDTFINHRIMIKELIGDSLADMLNIMPEGNARYFNIDIPEDHLKDLPKGATVKVMKVIVFAKVEEPTKDELKSNGNAEIKKSVTEVTLAVDNLSVYPNPSSGKLTVDFDLTEKGKTQLLVTDLQGKEVYEEEFTSDGGFQTRQLDLSEQAGGVYLLKIKTGEKSTVRKIVLQQSAK